MKSRFGHAHKYTRAHTHSERTDGHAPHSPSFNGQSSEIQIRKIGTDIRDTLGEVASCLVFFSGSFFIPSATHVYEEVASCSIFFGQVQFFISREIFAMTR